MTQTNRELWIRIEAKLKFVLHQIENQLEDKDRSRIEEYFGYNEYGVARDLMVWLIETRAIALTPEADAALHDVATMFGE